MTVQHLLSISWSVSSLLLLSLDHRNRHPREPDHARHDPIGDFAVPRVGAEAQTETAVDDTQCNETPAEGNVRHGPNAGLAVTDVDRVMKLTQNGLNGEQANHDDADDGMSIVDLVDITISRCFYWFLSKNTGRKGIKHFLIRTCRSGLSAIHTPSPRPVEART